MNRWLYNDSWECFKKTLDYIGFSSQAERSLVSIGDRVVYCSSGIVAGIFEAESYCAEVFLAWSERRPFQVRLKPLFVPDSELNVLSYNGSGMDF